MFLRCFRVDLKVFLFMPVSRPRSAIRVRPVVVCIPAHDEAAEILPCLLALARQTVPIDSVVLCLNNCHDDTAAVVRAHSGRLPFPLHAIEVTLPELRASAGEARRIAMDHAAILARGDGALLTTDADARVPPGWVATNLAALEAGAEVVAGRAVIEPEGAKAIPAHVHATDAREAVYAALLDEIYARVDPDPADPWPRHDEESGASIAVTVAAYTRVGGMPAVALGEDRAFFDAARRVDARIRHSLDISVIVSARIEGRAGGGMADTMRRRMVRPDPFLDERLEPAVDVLRRARLRRLLRELWSMPECIAMSVAGQIGVSASCLTELLKAPYFGEAWTAIEMESPVLQHRAKVALEALEAQTRRARRIRDWLRRKADGASAAVRIAAE
jgi:GT2 family glycosyltransferase